MVILNLSLRTTSQQRQTKREKKMTFSTFDIDAGTASESGVSVFETSNPARHTRSRRHSALRSRRSCGARIAGFGF